MNNEPEFEPQDTSVEPDVEPLEEQQTTAYASAPETLQSETVPLGAVTAAEIDRKVQGGMFGVPEMIVFGFSCLVLLGVLGFYFLVVAPAQSDLKTRKAQHNEQDAKLQNLKVKYKDFSTSEEFVKTLEQSVMNFESSHLPIASIGKVGLYDRLNGLMYAYRLRNTAGPDYLPLEIVNQRNDQPQEERGKNKFQTLFPGVYINMTVEGTYASLRRFIGEIESSPQFVIISTVELQSTENKEEEPVQTGPPPQQPGMNPGMNPAGMGGKRMGAPVTGPTQPLRTAAPEGKTLGKIVSLHIELATYFRREPAAGSALLPSGATP